MPGPNGTPVLDDFNRADSPGDLGANWTEDITTEGFAEPSIVSNQLDGVGFDNAWWNVTQFGVDQEVFVTVKTNPDNEGRIYCRLANVPGTSANGYEFAWGGGDSTLTRLNGSGGDRTQLGANLGYSVAVNDRIALVCIGTTISAWKDTGGGWTLVADRTDATYTNAGYLGVWSQNNTAFALDDFGGGVAVAANAPSLRIIRSSLRW